MHYLFEFALKVIILVILMNNSFFKSDDSQKMAFKKSLEFQG